MAVGVAGGVWAAGDNARSRHLEFERRNCRLTYKYVMPPAFREVLGFHLVTTVSEVHMQFFYSGDNSDSFALVPAFSTELSPRLLNQIRQLPHLEMIWVEDGSADGVEMINHVRALDLGAEVGERHMTYYARKKEAYTNAQRTNSFSIRHFVTIAALVFGFLVTTNRSLGWVVEKSRPKDR